MAYRPFAFGSGAGAVFSFSSTSMPSMQEQVEEEDVGVESADLASELAATLDKMRRVSAERDTALKAEGIARSVVEALRATWSSSSSQTTMADSASEQLDALKHENELLKAKRNEDTNTIEGVQSEIHKVKDENLAKDAEIEQLKKKLDANERNHTESNKAYERRLDEIKEDLVRSTRYVEKLKDNAEEHEAKVAHNESILSRVHDELDHARAAYHAADQAKDDVEVERLDLELQLKSLHQEWEEQQGKIKELEDRCDQVSALETQLDSLQEDLDRQTEIMAEHSRTLLVKDERIAHLEAQYQKERQKTMNAADAAANATVAAATSFDHHAPPPFKSLGESLEDQLSDNYDEFEYLEDEQLYYSSISSISCAPVEPVIPIRTIEVKESASTAPIEIAVPKLSLSINEPVSTIPVEIAAPKLSLSVNEPVSTTPLDIAVPKFSLIINEPVSTAPLAVDTPKLSLSVNEPVSTIPIEIAVPRLSLSINEPVSTMPVEVSAPKLTVNINESISTIPVDIVTPKLGLSINESISTAPIDIAVPKLNFSIEESVNFAPVEVVAPKLSLSIREAVSVMPIDRKSNSTSTSVQTEAQELSITMFPETIIELAPTEPERITTTPISTQTDVQQLSITVLDKAMVDIKPVKRKSIDTDSISIQTEAPRLTSDVIHSASVAVAPTELNIVEISSMSTQTDAPQLTSDILHSVSIAPVAPELNIVIAPIQETYKAEPSEASPPMALTTSFISTVIENEPVEVLPHGVPTEPSTTSSSAQTSELPAQLIQTPTTLTSASKANRVSLLHTLIAIMAALFFLHLFAELQAWRTANGVGYKYHHSGAYGNGRYLFGIIPLAMDEGGNFFSEQLARYTSMAITSIESWAGMPAVAHY